MNAGLEALPDDIDALKAALIVARAEAAAARAQQSDDQALIAHLKLQIEKLNRELWSSLGAHRATAGSARADAGGAGKLGHRGRTHCRNGCSQNHEGGVVHPQAAVTSTVPGAFAPRTADGAGTDSMRLLWWFAAVEARRGHHRDTGGDPEILEGGPARPREVHLPRLREDQPGSGAIPRDRQRLGRSQSFGDDPVREVWPASTTEQASGALCQGRRADQPIDPGRPSRRLYGGVDALVQAPRSLRPVRRAAARR